MCLCVLEESLMIKVTSIMIKNINYDKMILMVTKVTSMVSYRFCATQATWPISLLVFPMLLRYVQNWISGHLKQRYGKVLNVKTKTAGGWVVKLICKKKNFGSLSNLLILPIRTYQSPTRGSQWSQNM